MLNKYVLSTSTAGKSAPTWYSFHHYKTRQGLRVGSYSGVKQNRKLSEYLKYI